MQGFPKKHHADRRAESSLSAGFAHSDATPDWLGVIVQWVEFAVLEVDTPGKD